MRSSLLLVILLKNLVLFGQTDSLNYFDAYNWAVKPTSYPEGLKSYIQDTLIEHTDVFYVYPTLLVSDKDTLWNYPVTNEKHRKNVIESAVKFQASAWATQAGSLRCRSRQAALVPMARKCATATQRDR